MRIPKRLLPHKIKVAPRLGTGARGAKYGPAVEWDRVYVEDKRQMVVTSEGADATSNTFVIMDPERIIPEGSLVTVWPGTYRERTAPVVSHSFYDFPGAPSNLQVFIT